jgi:drug/metabolite transporter (DMT)-like permease
VSAAREAPPLASAFGIFCALGSAVGYGVNIVSAREAALAGVSGPEIILFRVGLMFLAVVGIVLAGRVPLAVPTEERPMLGLLVLVSALMGVSYISAVAFVPVTLAVVIFYTYPVIVILSAPLVTGEQLTPIRLGIVALAFAGLVAVVGPAFDRLDWRGVALAGIAALFTAVQFHTGARTRRTPLLVKLFWLHVGMLPIALAVCLPTVGVPRPHSLLFAPYAVAITIGGYVVGLSLQLAALTRIAPTLASLIFCLEPLVSAVGSMTYLGERLDAVQVAGGAAVLAAVVASVLGKPRRAT